MCALVPGGVASSSLVPLILCCLPPVVILHVASYLDLRTGPWCHTYFILFFSVFSVMHAWVKKNIYVYDKNVLCCVHFSGGEGRWGEGVTHPHTHTLLLRACTRVHPNPTLVARWLFATTTTTTTKYTHHKNTADYRDRTSVCTHDVDVPKVLDNKTWCHYSYWPVLLLVFFMFLFCFECSNVTLDWLTAAHITRLHVISWSWW